MSRLALTSLLTASLGAAACGATTDVQNPPEGAALTAWLADRPYTTWRCEPAPHPERKPGPHGITRICSNTLLSQHGAGEYPVGSAAVKELYDESGARVVGHAVYRKTKPGGTESFYYYEAMNGAVAADGLGTGGVSKMVCAGCHAAAGSDAEHPGHDAVYTQVR